MVGDRKLARRQEAGQDARKGHSSRTVRVSVGATARYFGSINLGKPILLIHLARGASVPPRFSTSLEPVRPRPGVDDRRGIAVWWNQPHLDELDEASTTSP